MEETIYFLRLIGYNYESKNADQLFAKLLAHLISLVNSTNSNVRGIEEKYRLHSEFYTQYFRKDQLCQAMFENSIKSSEEPIIAMRLYSFELAKRLQPMCHLLRNPNNFFTRQNTAKTVEAVTLLMTEQCANPDLLLNLSTIRDKLVIYMLSGTKNKMLKTNSNVYSVD